MGAADGATFAPPKPGSKPIIAPPCGCAECVAGPGLYSREALIEKNLGGLVRVQCFDFCPSCMDTVIVTATRNGPGWHNQCRDGHTWLTNGS
jgi:hypothetical protein